jgi:hypothetical protein
VHAGEPISKYTKIFAGAQFDDAYQEAGYRWDGIRAKGWFALKSREWMTPICLWWTKNAQEHAWGLDIRDLIPSNPA